MDIKKTFKKIKPLYSIYYRFIGSKREMKVIEEKKNALQLRGGEILNLIDDTLKDSQISYFLDFGSLLGIVRDHGFIKWDSDMDYGIIIDEEFSYDYLEKLLNKVGLTKIREFIVNDLVVEQTYSKGSLTIDFFAHFIEDNEAESVTYCCFKKKDFSYNREEQFHVSRLTMRAIRSIDRLSVGDIEINVPNDPKKYLASIYTDNWRIPDPNWVSEKGPAWNEIPCSFGYCKCF